MNASVHEYLTRTLWIDFLMGSMSGIAGLVFYNWFSKLLGLPPAIVLIISIVTFIYSLFAFWLARRGMVMAGPVRVLIYANFIWAVVSIIMLFMYFAAATLYGKLYLILQILVVGGLAFFERYLLDKYKVYNNI